MTEPKKKRITHNYIDNKKLFAEMDAFIRARRAAIAKGDTPPQIPRYIGESLILIATNLAKKPCFSGYSFRDDMIGDGIENCVMYLHNFNPDKSNNPFAYFSLMMHRAFVRKIQKEQKHSYIRHKAMFNASLFQDIGMYDAADSSYISSVLESLDNSKSADVIEKFESKLKEKKQKAKERSNES